jgi:hypothetical protein
MLAILRAAIIVNDSAKKLTLLGLLDESGALTPQGLSVIRHATELEKSALDWLETIPVSLDGRQMRAHTSHLDRLRHALGHT